MNLEDLREFTTHYKNKEVKEHEGGHFIPGTKEMRNLYLEYVKKFINWKYIRFVISYFSVIFEWVVKQV